LHPGGVPSASDEGLWRVDIATGAKEQILPLFQHPKMMDFAIGPHDGFLYVLFNDGTDQRLETFDPVTGASMGVLLQSTEGFRSVEFFPN
jgi:hypothetical protein